MRRGDRTGGKVKARRHKALTLKAMRRRSSSAAGRETSVARLSRELSEAFEQQAATAEILNVISNSPTDTQPVFDAIVQSGLKLFPGALVSVALRYGDTINAAAVAAPDPARVEAWRRTISRTPLARNYMHGAALLDRRIVDIPDVADAPAEFFAGGQNFLTSGNRAITIMPMMRGDEAIGLLSVVRLVPGPLSDKQIAILGTFAAQAVIAVENTRLLNELRERTSEVERSYGLVQQQASQLEAQSQELFKLNQQLEQRVVDQVGEIERMGRLRRFLPPQVADLIVASGTEKQLESHRREITALFCDLRGFTGFSESSDPEDVMALLRQYHAAIGETLVKYSGTLERFAGDGVMVIFNDPVPVSNPALQAVQMALDMRVTIGALIEKWLRLGHDIGFGIGIAHGYATLGTIGFEGRFDYAAIGTVSNVASRLCDEAKPGQILISPRVMMAVEDAVAVEPVGDFSLKGIRRPMPAYNVLAALPSKS
jgi:class 3 adenylate cyclase